MAYNIEIVRTHKSTHCVKLGGELYYRRWCHISLDFIIAGVHCQAGPRAAIDRQMHCKTRIQQNLRNT